MRSEGGSAGRVIGGVRDRPKLSVSIVVGLAALSTPLSCAFSSIFSVNADSTLIKMLPSFTVLYLATAGPIIAGVCEEFT